MFQYEKKLQYPVKIANPNPKLAMAIITQYGGPDGELGASLRYLSQRYSMPYAELKGLLTDIGISGTKMSLRGEMYFSPQRFYLRGIAVRPGHTPRRGRAENVGSR